MKTKDQLYLEIEICTANNETKIYTSVQSFVALYVYRFLQDPANVELRFVRNSLPYKAKVELYSETLREQLTQDILCKQAAEMHAIRDLHLPVYAKDRNTYVGGMCAVCRELVARQSNDDYQKLLGFKEGCLLAPAEASVWTRFCEVDVVDAVYHMLGTDVLTEMPKELQRFECHLGEPVRMHNIYKVAQNIYKTNKLLTSAEKGDGSKKRKVFTDCRIPKELLPIEHTYAEGPTFTIADLILYPCLSMIFDRCPEMISSFHNTYRWFAMINSHNKLCLDIYKKLQIAAPELVLPKQLKPIARNAYASVSLYKKDPKRHKPRKRIYTEQSEVDASLAKLQHLQLDFNSESATVFDQSTVDWNLIEPDHEKSSALPQERLLRKRQQLENLVNAVISLASPGARIVDFCSGTGHLAILLAVKLPQCSIILMENKAISLERAKKRATDMNLRNCIFYQCNIDYFDGKFDIGTSLHACGTATDIVLQQCYRARAKFVCCPCCYGSMQPMPHISYPLSKRFRTVLDEKGFLHIAHSADQAHELGTKNCNAEMTRQGQLCMDIVDTDRKLQAEEAGYEVILTRLKPEICTPKNRLLVGRIASAPVETVAEVDVEMAAETPIEM